MGIGRYLFEGELWKRKASNVIDTLGPCYCGASTGSSNAYVLTTPFPVEALTDGMRFSFKPNFTNTGACTLNVNGFGAKDITQQSGTALASGDIDSGYIIDVVYKASADDFIVLSAVATTVAGITSLNALTASVQTLATGTSGTDFAISSATSTHTFNLPVASGTNTGKLSNTDWTTFNNKQAAGNYITALTSDVTASGPGSVAATIAANAVTNAKFRQSAGLSVVGRSANSTGNVADITASNDAEVLRRSGTSVGFGTIATAGIANDAVTYAKIQNVSAASKLLGRGSAAGAGDVEEITLGSNLSMSGTTLSATDTVGITSLNSLTAAAQTLEVDTGGTDFTITSSVDKHVFDLPTASATKRGALSSSDWSTFNAKVSTSRAINTTSPLSGGGDLSADRTLSIANAAADGSTKGAASFNSSDFNSSSGNISIDYTNAQAASGSNKGFLTSADWSIFNAKQDELFCGTSGGSANAYTLTTPYTLTSFTDGFILYFYPNFSNTGAATINVNSIGAKDIVYPDGSNIIANAIIINRVCALFYDETTAGGFIILNPQATTSGITTLNTLTATTQTFAVGTSGTDFAISSATSTHTFNLPTASASNRGALSSADWTTFNDKLDDFGTGTSFSPTVGGSGSMSVSDGGGTYLYWQINDIVIASYYTTALTTSGTASSDITFTLPVTASGATFGGGCRVGDPGLISGSWDLSSTTVARFRRYDATNFGLGSGRDVMAVIIYQAA